MVLDYRRVRISLRENTHVHKEQRPRQHYNKQASSEDREAGTKGRNTSSIAHLYLLHCCSLICQDVET